MEVYAYGDILYGEGCCLVHRREQQLAVGIAVPQQSSLGEGHLLVACQLLALGKVWLVEREANLFRADQSHANLWLAFQHGNFRCCLLSCLYSVCNFLGLLFRHGYLLQYVLGRLLRHVVEILAAWQYEQAGHVERSG